MQLGLAEVARVGRNDEEKTGDRKCNTRHDHSDSVNPQPRDLGGDKPYTGEEDQQESDFREAHTGVGRHRKDDVHASHSL
jgi:hypothetical protein